MITQWYYLLFFVSIAFFLIKTVISWVAGEVDVDFDADGDTDFDVSSMFSFKGCLHFLLGFSTFLSAVAKFEHPTESYVSFSGFEYVCAAFVGVIFTVVLFILYKTMMKLNHNTDNMPNFDGCECSILTKNDDGTYGVLIKTYNGTYKKDYPIARFFEGSLSIGSTHKIQQIADGSYYIV